jgi:hypothetical protein
MEESGAAMDSREPVHLGPLRIFLVYIQYIRSSYFDVAMTLGCASIFENDMELNGEAQICYTEV